MKLHYKLRLVRKDVKLDSSYWIVRNNTKLLYKLWIICNDAKLLCDLWIIRNDKKLYFSHYVLLSFRSILRICALTVAHSAHVLYANTRVRYTNLLVMVPFELTQTINLPRWHRVMPVLHSAFPFRGVSPNDPLTVC